jgi:hypothetical protein
MIEIVSANETAPEKTPVGSAFYSLLDSLVNAQKLPGHCKNVFSLQQVDLHRHERVHRALYGPAGFAHKPMIGLFVAKGRHWADCSDAMVAPLRRGPHHANIIISPSLHRNVQPLLEQAA